MITAKGIEIWKRKGLHTGKLIQKERGRERMSKRGESVREEGGEKVR